MQVSVESPSKIERCLTVVVSTEQVEEAYDKSIAKLAKKAKVDGFRPGKVPLEHIKKRFGDVARQEALSEVIQSSLYAAIHQEKLSPVSTPQVEPKVVSPGQPLEFVATFEVLPIIDAVQFQLNKIEKQVTSITEADIDTVIDRLRGQHTQWQAAERPAQEKDQVVIDFRGSIEGKVFDGGEAHNYSVVLGSKTMIPGFEEGLVGLKAGEEKILSVSFPENYPAKEFAGKAAEFAVTVIKVSEPHLPDLNEDLVKKLGVKSGMIEELRSEIGKNLKREIERLIKAKLKSKVFDTLLEQNPIEAPKALIDREAKRIHEELHPHHAKQQDHKHSEAEMAPFTDAAKRNVALGLIVGELIKQHKLTASNEQVQTYLQNMAAVYEDPSKVINWYTNNKRAYAEIEMQVLEELTIEKLLEKVEIIENVLSYNEFITG